MQDLQQPYTALLAAMGGFSLSPEHCRETALLLLLCWLFSTKAADFSRTGALPGARHFSELLVAEAKYIVRWICGAGVSLKLLWPLEHSPRSNWCVTNGESPQRTAWSIAGRGSCNVTLWTGSYSAPSNLLAVEGLEQQVSHIKLLQYLVYLDTAHTYSHLYCSYHTKLFPSGFPTDGLAPAVWQGGETEALARLDKHLERKVIPPPV